MPLLYSPRLAWGVKGPWPHKGISPGSGSLAWKGRPVGVLCGGWGSEKSGGNGVRPVLNHLPRPPGRGSPCPSRNIPWCTQNWLFPVTGSFPLLPSPAPNKLLTQVLFSLPEAAGEGGQVRGAAASYGGGCWVQILVPCGLS